ncbi:ATP-grasp domain-containing protein [Noviherbaspirillum suwonense]|uniref:ATP-grasp domain-containing protein n=2 Tax=Noviherbaspirillum suwonense TaxID=1224511 RepID=A0ABY1PU14_9BURK|nr:ATP-grasp domain-containing protein [Noviherbaspirillum suwonense]
MLSCAGFHADRPLLGVLGDLCRLPGVEVTLLRAPGLARLQLPDAVRVIPCAPERAAETVGACIADADAVWPVVPESYGMLELASRHILGCGSLLLGSRPDAVSVAASKHETARVLKAAGIAVVDTFLLHDALPAGASAWVVKPDDGAGCSETRIYADCDAARLATGERDGGRYVMQPYLRGAHRSMSMVCADEQVLLMSVNEQRMAVFDNQLHYMGSTVNGVREQQRQCRALAERVIGALPGLWGCVGIDFIMTEDGPVVLEVNPRVTMAHAALRQSTGHNPAQLLLELLLGKSCAPLEARRIKPVSIDISPFPEPPESRHRNAAG